MGLGLTQALHRWILEGQMSSYSKGCLHRFNFLYVFTNDDLKKKKNTASIGVLSLESTLVEPTRY